ncbi:MAG: AAA family ATPase [Brevinema sp.]
MQIHSFSFKNFKGFSEISKDLHPKINAIIGINGAGKTSILEGLVLLLNRTLPNPSNSKSLIFKKEYYVKQGTSDTEIRVQFSSSIYGENQYVKFATPKPNGYLLSNFMDKRRELSHQLLAKESILDLPAILFYRTDRVVKDLLPERLKGAHSFTQSSVYRDCLNNPINFRLFFEWFRNEDDIENQIVREKKDWNYKNKKLAVVRKAIEDFTGFTELKIKRRPLKMELIKDGHCFNINLLSQGELSYLALVADIAQRLSILNETMDNPLEGKGIVLIDEVELHLHPKWQAEILPKLSSTFPNCQFIITTHSPMVIANLKKENVIILDNEHEMPSEIYGKTTDDILTQVMGLNSSRPKKVQDVLDRIYSNISLEDIDLLEQDYKILEGYLVDDSELTGIRAIISRLKWKRAQQ